MNLLEIRLGGLHGTRFLPQGEPSGGPALHCTSDNSRVICENPLNKNGQPWYAFTALLGHKPSQQVPLGIFFAKLPFFLVAMSDHASPLEELEKRSP